MAGFIKQRKKIPITMKRVGRELPKLIPVDVPFPLAGIHLERPRDQVVAGSAIDTDGIMLRRGALERAHGRTLSGSVLDGSVIMLADYLTAASILETFAASRLTLYKFDTDWTAIPKNPVGNMGGTDADIFWATQIGNDLLFCQNVDPVYRYSGGADFAILNANCPTAKFGIGHQGRLLLAGTTEGGTEYPYRVRWNVIDSIADWTGAGSGYVDLDDTSDVVSCIGILNQYPVVFKESSIAVGSRTGQISPAYEFFGRDSLHGTKCPHAVVNLGDKLAYIGEEDIFVFDLNKSTSIGDAVRSRFFDEMNPDYKSQCFGYLVERLDEVRFCTPTGSSTYNDYEWIWNIKDGTWYRRHRETTCANLKLVSTAPTWDSLSNVTWNDMMQRWSSGAMQPSATRLVVGTHGGYIYEEDPTSHAMNGLAFESFYESGDIRIDQSKHSGVSYVEVRYKDVGVPCTLTVGLSNDGGVTWRNVSRALQTGTGSGRVFITLFPNIIAGTHIALRLYVNSATEHFEIVGVRLWMTTAGK